MSLINLHAKSGNCELYIIKKMSLIDLCENDIPIKICQLN